MAGRGDDIRGLRGGPKRYGRQRARQRHRVLAHPVLAYLILALAILVSGAVNAAETCATPRDMGGFRTCADVDQAEKEGTMVLYSTSPETNSAALLAAFHKAFPRISPDYVRLQAGALYAKILAERRASVHPVDALQMSDMGLALDFQRRDGWMLYNSPEHAAYKSDQKSRPEGYWAWGTIGMVGIAYNATLVPADEAPKNWPDALDPRWTNSITVKTANAGVQHDTWYALRRLYGDEYWKKFASLKPKAFDSWVQQFGRCVDGQDMIIHSAGYSSYLQMKAKGAPLSFNFPPDGMPVDVSAIGIVADAPHPQAARLFMDWLLGVPGQTALVEEAYSYSAREDVHPPEGGVPISTMKLLYPEDWETFEKSHPAFVRDWKRITGMP
jgi:iron(III) transport system substrate-binding protein